MITSSTIHSRPLLKGLFPFRLGATSYTIQADMLSNLMYLAPLVDDVELVLFENGQLSNLPRETDLLAMAQLAQQQNLTYTVHLFGDLDIGSSQKAQRQQALQNHIRIMELTAVLQPWAWILHLHGDNGGPPPQQELASWQKRTVTSLREIMGNNFAPHQICVENLGYKFSLLTPIIEELDLAVCLDIGHLLLQDLEVGPYLDQWLTKTRVLHLHGLQNGVDHIAASHLPPGLLADLLTRLQAPGQPARVLTMEVFSETDFLDSLQAVAQAL